MISGEYIDTELEGKQISAQTLEYIHKNKTGALLKLCVRMGAILANASEKDINKLTKIIQTYGEEKYAKSISSGIIKARNIKPIETTIELTEIIKQNVPEKYRNKSHPARKTFQAIRIEVNDELNVFKKALESALEIIKPGGVICVITFHSLEDKICKQIFKKVSELPKELQNLPVIPKQYEPKYKIIANIKPSNNEIKNNKRARSARLRVLERIR